MFGELFAKIKKGTEGQSIVKSCGTNKLTYTVGTQHALEVHVVAYIHVARMWMWYLKGNERKHKAKL